MNRYAVTIPRVTLVIAALAMTVLTFGAFVVAPAHEEAGALPAATVAHAAVDAPAPIEVAIIPARIDVVAEREPQTIFGAVRQFIARRAQSS
jgi:hypothetical protein